MERSLPRRGWRETITFSIQFATTWWLLLNAKLRSCGAWTGSKSSWQERSVKRMRLPRRRLCNKRGSIIMEAVRSRLKAATPTKITLQWTQQPKASLVWVHLLENLLLLELQLAKLKRNLLLRQQLSGHWWKVWSKLPKNRKLLQLIIRRLNLVPKCLREDW